MSMFRTKRMVSRKFASVNGVVAGPSYLVSDDLTYADATEAAAGGWVDTGTPVWGYSTAPVPLVSGFNDALNLDSSTDTTYKSFTAQADVWVFAVVNASSIGAALTDTLRIATSNGATNLVRCNYRTDGSIRLYAADGSFQATAAGLISGGATRYLWVRYQANSGGVAVSTIYVSSTTTRPGSASATKASAAAGADAARVAFGATGQTMNLIVSKLRVSASEIGNNPA